MKKLITYLLLCILSFTLVGCLKYEDLVPSDDEFGQWDGNYIYIGNVRSKTTGEDEQILVENIVYNEVEFSFVTLYDYTYIKDKNNNNIIIMIIECENYQDESLSFLVEYDIKTKKTNVLYTVDNDNHLSSIMLVYENRYIYLSVNSVSSNYKYYVRYDYQLKNIINLSVYNITHFLDDVLIININGISYYMKYNSTELIEIGKIPDESYCKIIKSHNKKYIRILGSEFISSFRYHNSLAYYDFNDNKLYYLLDLSDQKQFKILNDEYFIFYESKKYDYISSIKNLQTGKYEILSAYLDTNNEIYKINFDSMQLEFIYKFEKTDVSYTSGYIINNKYYISTTKIKRGNLFRQGGYIYNYYVLDLDTLELKKTSSNHDKKEINVNDSRIKVGDYEYYIVEKTIGAFARRKYVYYLYRYDKALEEEKIMQFLAYEYDEIMGVRYSELFWDMYVEDSQLFNVLICEY